MPSSPVLFLQHKLRLARDPEQLVGAQTFGEGILTAYKMLNRNLL
jgi:hypothetical protein